jgi:hypothetical protein
VRVAHGVPGRNRVGFYEDQPAEQIVSEVRDVRERTLISAHTHVQIDRVVRLEPSMGAALHADPHVGSHDRQAAAELRWHIVNPGSVGLPLNRDTRAQYAILDSVDSSSVWGGWRCTLCHVAYDRRPALAAFKETGMLASGGAISQLFYWELVTAEAEIIRFYQWAYANGLNPEDEVASTFEEYVAATGRDRYVWQRDPLHSRSG